MKRKNKCANKKKYSTISLTKEVIKKSYLERGVKLRHYECPVCLDFHLTSKNTEPMEKTYRAWDRADIKNKYFLFENLLKSFTEKIDKKRKLERREQRRLQNDVRRELYETKKPEFDALLHKQMVWQARFDPELDVIVGKKKQKQVGLLATRAIFQQLKHNDNMALFYFKLILARFDYPQFVWKSVIWLK
jgi:hypothetical protein